MCGCRKNLPPRSVEARPRAQISSPVQSKPTPQVQPDVRTPIVRTPVLRAPAPAPVPVPVPTVASASRSSIPRIGRNRAVSKQELKTKSGLTVHNTSVWGAKLWYVLHMVAAAADKPSVLNAWKAVPAALRVSLPCPDCDRHFNNWCDSRSPPTDTAHAVRTWLLDLHNNVNMRNGRPPWTLAELSSYYVATPETMAAALATLWDLNDIIGQPAYDALTAAINA